MRSQDTPFSLLQFQPANADSRPPPLFKSGQALLTCEQSKSGKSNLMYYIHFIEEKLKAMARLHIELLTYFTAISDRF